MGMGRLRSEKEEEPTLFRKWFPQMDRAERQELFERIESGAQGGRDYAVMMMLLATLASLGLRQDSTSCVIGAMLAARSVTLMTQRASSMLNSWLALRYWS